MFDPAIAAIVPPPHVPATPFGVPTCRPRGQVQAAIAAAGVPMGSPRVDLVFRLWQCDKKNHGWREGPPLTGPCQVSICYRAFTLRYSQFRTKKEYCFTSADASPSIKPLAGLI
jgi:hypothetical protein